METYPRATTENLQALDFTYPAKQNATYQREITESPVLDLSVKKEPELTSAESTNVSTFSYCSNSPANTEKSHETNNYSESECKSPFEGRTFMVTPPSESDSPKKIKYEPLCNAVVLPTNNNAGQYGFAPVSMNMPMPVLPPLLPTILPHNGGQVPPIQITGVPVSSTTTTTVTGNYPRNAPPPSLSPDTGKKAPRPFKAYPKDPLSLSMGPAELIYDQNSTEAYSEFRKRMLDSVRRTNEGTNIKMRRVTKSPGLPTSTVDEKDAAYWERRRKNNEAAKRSRDARRAKEDEIAIRAAFLEQENMKLKYELVALRNETAKLRCMVYST